MSATAAVQPTRLCVGGGEAQQVPELEGLPWVDGSNAEGVAVGQAHLVAVQVPCELQHVLRLAQKEVRAQSRLVHKGSQQPRETRAGGGREGRAEEGELLRR